jgi:hypothetical protein
MGAVRKFNRTVREVGRQSKKNKGLTVRRLDVVLDLPLAGSTFFGPVFYLHSTIVLLTS